MKIDMSKMAQICENEKATELAGKLAQSSTMSVAEITELVWNIYFNQKATERNKTN